MGLNSIFGSLLIKLINFIKCVLAEWLKYFLVISKVLSSNPHWANKNRLWRGFKTKWFLLFFSSDWVEIHSVHSWKFQLQDYQRFFFQIKLKRYFLFLRETTINWMHCTQFQLVCDRRTDTPSYTDARKHLKREWGGKFEGEQSYAKEDHVSTITRDEGGHL